MKKCIKRDHLDKMESIQMEIEDEYTDSDGMPHFAASPSGPTLFAKVNVYVYLVKNDFMLRYNVGNELNNLGPVQYCYHSDGQIRQDQLLQAMHLDDANCNFQKEQGCYLSNIWTI